MRLRESFLWLRIPFATTKGMNARSEGNSNNAICKQLDKEAR